MSATVFAASLKSFLGNMYADFDIVGLSGAFLEIESGNLFEVKTLIDFIVANGESRVSMADVVVDTVGTALELGWSKENRVNLAKAIGTALSSSELDAIIMETEKDD